MLIVMPSDPATEKAAEYLLQEGVTHKVIPIPDSLGYKTGANIGIYLPGDSASALMIKLSAKGFVIMRVFKTFEPQEA